MALALALPLLLGAALPGEYGRLISAGRRSYVAGRFQEAGERFEAALKVQPGDPLAQMARGCARYRLQKWADAATDFAAVAQGQDSRLQEYAEYNSGNCLFRQEQYGDAVERYRRALTLDPTDQDAKFNLELALKRQQEDKPPPQEEQKQPQQSPKKEPQPRNEQNQEQPQGKPGDKQNDQSDASQAGKQETASGEMNAAQAGQLLDALAADETNQRRLTPRPPATGEEKATDKSW